MKRWFFRYLCIFGVVAILSTIAITGSFKISEMIDASSQKNAETIIVGTGLTVVAIAIAVWAGLNIATAFDRRELLDYTAKLREENDLVQRELEKTKTTLHDRYLQEFLLSLSSTLDPQHMRVSKWMSHIFQKQENYVSTDDLIKLTKYETVYNRVLLLYRHGNSDNAVIREVNDVSSEISSSIQEFGKKSKITAYLHFLFGELLYCSGFSYINKCSYVDSITVFLESAVEYREYVYLKYKFDIECHSEWGDNHSKEENEEMAYLMNEIGSCYSECIRCFNSADIETQNEIKEQENWDIDIILRYAKKCCNLSTTIQRKVGIEREVYFRNYGCVFEREYMYQISQKQTPDNVLLTDAAEQYRLAYRVCKTSHAIYHAIISNYDKQIRALLSIPIMLQKNEIPDTPSKALRKNKREDIMKLLQEQKRYIDVARNLFPLNERFVYFFIQSRAYYYLVEENGEKRIHEVESAKVALEYLALIAAEGRDGQFFGLANTAVNTWCC